LRLATKKFGREGEKKKGQELNESCGKKNKTGQAKKGPQNGSTKLYNKFSYIFFAVAV